jgi:DnaA family protein
MKQLLLKLDAARPQSLESFEVGHHAELIALLQRYVQRQPGSFGEHAAYIWGESGAGKSHLLRALETDSTAHYITPASPLADFEYTSEITLYLLDDCHDFDDLQQIAAFNLYNQVKENKCFFVASGISPPALLTVREDFRTRLGWGLIYQLQGLTDQEKITALERAAKVRGVTIPDGVLPYLITHFHRDMPSLASMLNALINHSLEIKHPITLPFLREVIQQQKVHHE